MNGVGGRWILELTHGPAGDVVVVNAYVRDIIYISQPSHLVAMWGWLYVNGIGGHPVEIGVALSPI